MVFLINEFAQSNIDEGRLSYAGLMTHSVVGGSLFCQCKAADLARVLQEEVWLRHLRTPFDAVIIETSGLADPNAIGKLLEQFSLTNLFEVARIVTVVSARRFPKIIDELPVVTAQLQSSDVVIVNKCDLVPGEQVEQCIQRIRSIQPHAKLMETEWCSVHLDWKAPKEAIIPDADLSTVEANPFATKVIPVRQLIPVQTIEEWLDELPEQVLRVKGTLPLADGCMEIDKTCDGTDIVLTPQKILKGELVLIVHDRDEAVLEAAAGALWGKLECTV